MKYKVGDRVRIKSLDWYNTNKDKINEVKCGVSVFIPAMTKHCGYIRTISKVFDVQKVYHLVEDNNLYTWTDEMIEELVEEEPNDCEKCGLTRNSIRCLFMDNCPHNKQKNIIEIPEDYVIKDENGNVINTTKIVLEKKEYPKTYGECCRVLGVSEFEYNHTGTKMWYRHKLMATLDNLILCRDAYWKIAGEEMGLGKPWEPDYETEDNNRIYVLTTDSNVVVKSSCYHCNYILAFPTAEMRDAFYENFKELIEICKELL